MKIKINLDIRQVLKFTCFHQQTQTLTVTTTVKNYKLKSFLSNYEKGLFNYVLGPMNQKQRRLLGNKFTAHNKLMGTILNCY